MNLHTATQSNKCFQSPAQGSSILRHCLWPPPPPISCYRPLQPSVPHSSYGEHVLEANQNPNWITRLGFKSVAHYLNQIRRAGNNSEDPIFDRSISAKRSLPFTDEEENYQQQIPGDADQGNHECLSRGTNGMKDENCTGEMEMQAIDGNCADEKEQEVKNEKCIREMAMRTLDGNCDGEKEHEVKHEKCIGEMEMRTLDGNFDGEKELLGLDGVTACIGELDRNEKPKM